MAKLKLYVLLWIIWYMLNRSRTLAVDFENMTSQYKNYGIINAVTNFVTFLAVWTATLSIAF
jgi:hypothetical protein